MEGSAKKPARADPAASPIQSLIDGLHDKYRDVTDGQVATYIPELATANPDQLGIAIMTADGYAYESGDARAPFTIQSISKPIVYGLALETHGREAVLERIGVEPSGDAFNAIAFDRSRNRPFNAMVNAGAIAAAALVAGERPDERLARILDVFRSFVGHAVTIDEAVYRSEVATGHRNRAIAHLELGAGMIEGDAEAHLDLYFRQCAITTTALDLAVMGATLANGGTNPVTGERALAAEHVRDVLSVMTSCGMYDYAGEWELRVGLPAKSGVGGGIMAVLPGQLGIGVFSPRLDAHGNSFRGLRICEELSAGLKLHMLAHRGAARTALRRRYGGDAVRSKRMRRAPARRLLDGLGGCVAVYELQGDLFFGNTEPVVRGLLADAEARHVIIDAGRTGSIDPVALSLLRAARDALAASGKTVRFVGVPRSVRDALGPGETTHAHDVDAALEEAEDALLRGSDIERIDIEPPIPLAEFDLLREFDAASLETLERHMVPRRYAAGDTIVRDGAPADALYFLVDGAVDVRIALEGEAGHIRLGSIEAGNVFGELALLGDRRRTADVVATEPVVALELGVERFEALSRSYPAIQRTLLVAVGRSLAERLRQANAEIRALAT